MKFRRKSTKTFPFFGSYSSTCARKKKEKKDISENFNLIAAFCSGPREVPSSGSVSLRLFFGSVPYRLQFSCKTLFGAAFHRLPPKAVRLLRVFSRSTGSFPGENRRSFKSLFHLRIRLKSVSPEDETPPSMTSTTRTQYHGVLTFSRSVPLINSIGLPTVTHSSVPPGPPLPRVFETIAPCLIAGFHKTKLKYMKIYENKFK